MLFLQFLFLACKHNMLGFGEMVSEVDLDWEHSSRLEEIQVNQLISLQQCCRSGTDYLAKSQFRNKWFGFRLCWGGSSANSGPVRSLSKHSHVSTCDICGSSSVNFCSSSSGLAALHHLSLRSRFDGRLRTPREVRHPL